ncbi:MCE family protein [[Mycobacterium] burgundiense]|uniref:MCE family protein n=1 Tax=[Mycobacterium] burgundiense TaxID=3064286 RepID=A0ABM9LUH0_9MYCO|nr:MCE family protein [Mycolicibacterium sp. MU0053]CAJ1504927.1 MCE family protein [Mycolicibacterium sp. MU0053]
METRQNQGLHPGWWTLILFAVVLGMVFGTWALFTRSFTPRIPVTVTSDRSGLVLETGAKVKMYGIQIGTVSAIGGGNQPVRLQLDIDPKQAEYIPANVTAQIKATTAFGAKYVDLVYPDDPAPQALSAGAVISADNVSTEVNTVFQNLTDVLKQIDPVKLNGVLSAVAEGLRDQGDTLGRATTAANNVLLELNPRSETIREDWQAVAGFSDTYSAAASDILTVLDAASTTATTIAGHADQLDSLLINLAGMSRSGTDLLGANKENLVNAVNTLEPTTRLVHKYDPQLTCMLVGGHWFLENGGYDVTGGINGKSVSTDVALLFGDDPYRFPQHLPIVGAKGGPGGQPGCGSLPIVDDNFPHRHLVTNTGWGTGLDLRPNPGIGFPGWANYFPTTRGVPEPPSIRYEGPPAPGPIPYPGAPAYGAQLYAPDGAPLWPGLPEAPPPGQPREPGPPPPGSEPFSPPAP